MLDVWPEFRDLLGRSLWVAFTLASEAVIFVAGWFLRLWIGACIRSVLASCVYAVSVYRLFKMGG